MILRSVLHFAFSPLKHLRYFEKERKPGCEELPGLSVRFIPISENLVWLGDEQKLAPTTIIMQQRMRRFFHIYWPGVKMAGV